MVHPDVLDESGNSMPRTTNILQSHPDRVSNVIITSRYNLLTFLPSVALELLHPLKRFHNFYFFVVGLLQMIPAITITQGVPNTWMSLLFIMGCDMVLIAREDVNRHQGDKQTNGQATRIIAAEDDDGEQSRQST